MNFDLNIKCSEFSIRSIFLKIREIDEKLNCPLNYNDKFCASEMLMLNYFAFTYDC